MLTLPVDGIVPYDRYDVPSTGVPGGVSRSHPLFATKSFCDVALLRSAPIRPTPVGATMRPPAPTTMPFALATNSAGENPRTSTDASKP